MLNMETPKINSLKVTGKFGFPCGFLGAIVTFGVAFFPMFYRLIEGRNNHFQREEALEKQVAAFLEKQGKTAPAVTKRPREMNAKAWAASNYSDNSSFHHRLFIIQRPYRSMKRNRTSFLLRLFQSECSCRRRYP